jgi:hypothetical protein
MEVSENREFFTRIAMIHFPSLGTYLNKETSSVLGTIDAWAMTLQDITTQEAISVVYRWSKDELPRPQYYELGDFALHLRAVVLQDRVNARKTQLVDMIRDREEPRGNYSHVSLRPYIARVLESGEQCKIGKITREEHYATRDQVLADLAAAQVRR